MKSIELLDAARKRHHLTSDYQLAKRLGISTARMGNYRTERSRLDNEMCVKVAELLDRDPLEVIALVEAERARDAEQKKFWLKIAGAVVVFVLAVGVNIEPSSPIMQAGAVSKALYIMSNAALAFILWNLRLVLISTPRRA